MWRDPMDELIEDLERMVPAERRRVGLSWESFEEIRRLVDQVLDGVQHYPPNDHAVAHVDDEPDQEAEALGRPRRRFPRHDDKPTMSS